MSPLIPSTRSNPQNEYSSCQDFLCASVHLFHKGLLSPLQDVLP